MRKRSRHTNHSSGSGPRPFHVEPLEDRRLLANVTVDTELDVVDAGDGLTSLREAIAATNTMSGPDEIVFVFDGPAKVLLTQGELKITDSLSINGPGAELLTIDASGSDPTPNSIFGDDNFEDDGDGTRIFHIDDGNEVVDSPCDNSRTDTY
jgi:hypothetical protein